jgi:hypothetical protein
MNFRRAPAALRRLFVAVLVAGGWEAAVQADSSVVAVLTSDSGPYAEAYRGFEAAYGRRVPKIDLSSGSFHRPPDAKYVVAFGGKAAVQDYPRDTVLIYCMAPAVRLAATGRVAVHVPMLAAPARLVEAMLELQPAMKTLGVFWISEASREYVEALGPVLERRGVRLIASRLKDADGLPDALRALTGKADALWIPPDPLLITPRNIVLVRDYSWANRVPFYSPIAGLAENGAAAAVSSPYAAVGAAAARVLMRLAAGQEPGDAFPETLEIVVNLTASARSGLTVSNVLEKAARVLP